MLTWKRSILGIALLAGSFLACGDNNDNKDAAPLGKLDAALPIGGAGGVTGTGGGVGADAPMGAGGSVGIDAMPGAGGSVGIDAMPGAGGAVGVDGSAIDGGGFVLTPVDINAPTTAVSLTVTGTSATYDPAAGTCK